MVKKRILSIALASVVAVTSMCLLMGVRDAKAQSMDALMKRIEALESRSTGNVSVPKIRGLKIGLEVRHRFEQRVQFPNASALGIPAQVAGSGGLFRYGPVSGASTTNRGGLGRAPDSEFVLQRTRLSFDADVNKNVRAKFVLQDARTYGDNQTTGNATDEDSMLEGYVELRNLGDLSPILENITFRIGRWQMAYGNHRLIGTLNWANQARTYDGARMRWSNGKNAWIDAFVFTHDEDTTGGTAGNFTASAADEIVYGLYSQFKLSGPLKGSLIEPYIIVRDQNSDPHDNLNELGEERYSAGLRLDGRNMESLPGVDFTFEPVWQFGEVVGQRQGSIRVGADIDTNVARNTGETNEIQAFALYAGAGYTFKDIPWTPRIGYAYAFASGDDRPYSGAAKTFDHLYPTGHAQLGYIDLSAAWQNIRDHQIHFSVKPTKKMVIDVKTHFFELDEEADHWYSVVGGTGWANSPGLIRAGADQFVDENGAIKDVDDELAQEIDVTVKYKLFKNFGVVAGYSHWFSGDFIEDTSGGVGGDDRGADWFYLQTTMKF